MAEEIQIGLQDSRFNFQMPETCSPSLAWQRVFWEADAARDTCLTRHDGPATDRRALASNVGQLGGAGAVKCGESRGRLDCLAGIRGCQAKATPDGKGAEQHVLQTLVCTRHVFRCLLEAPFARERQHDEMSGSLERHWSVLHGGLGQPRVMMTPRPSWAGSQG